MSPALLANRPVDSIKNIANLVRTHRVSVYKHEDVRTYNFARLVCWCRSSHVHAYALRR